MFKKILLWSAYAVFAGVLIAGAVNRTNARMGDAVQANNGNGRGQGNDLGYALDQGNGWQPGNGQTSEQPLAAQEEHTWQSLSGEVTSAAADLVIVTTPSGEAVEIGGRPWSFAQEVGFSVQPEDQLALSGFYENGVFEVAAIDDFTSGASIQVRDEVGRPLWAGGRGRGDH
jgi:hypothetical protein